MREWGPLANLLEIEQPIINNIFILKPTFFRSLSFTTGGRTWRFGCILQIKCEKKNREFKVYITSNSLLLSVVQHTEPGS